MDLNMKELELSFMYICVPVLLLIYMLNITVVRILKGQEKTIVNQLMKLDCIVSILFSSLTTFQQSPLYRGMAVEFYCLIHNILFYTFFSLHMLIPVAIVFIR